MDQSKLVSHDATNLAKIIGILLMFMHHFWATDWVLYPNKLIFVTSTKVGGGTHAFRENLCCNV